MLSKTKKIAFLTTSLVGALATSSIIGVALSSCTTNDVSISNKPNKYTYSIDWTDQNQIKQLIIDEQGLVYSSADKTEIITVAPNTAATSFVIPSSVKYITGYNEITKNSSGVVTSSLSKGAFQNQTSLVSITFASDNTLISIGDSSFKGCTYLSIIDLPSSTSTINANAFENCANLRSISLASVSYIGSNAFKNAMANGGEVNIDLSSASYVGDNAFENSTSLAKVDFNKNTTLTYIGRSAFNNTLINGSSITTIDLSKATTLKTISDSAFAGCTKLGSIILPTTSVLTTIGANAFNGATSLTQVGPMANTFTAPSSLGNYVLTTITNGIDYVSSGIGANAFNGTKISKIDLSAATNTTTPFTNASFKNMVALTTINFGSSSKITTIPYSLFEGASALTSIVLPASITTINNGANNTNNGSTYVDQRSPFYNSGLQSIDMSAITSYATGTTTWFSTNIDNTTMLPVNLFQGLTSLETVILKTGTVVIGSHAFNGASSLTSVKENNTSTLEVNNDSGLVIPTTLQMINTSAFEGAGIKSVSFANSSSTANNNLWFLGKEVFKDATALTTVDLTFADTTNTHSIASGAFYDSGNATTTTEVIGFSSISINSFSGASALTSVNLPSSIKNIYKGAFTNNTSLNSVNFDNLTNLISIETNNFNGTKLTNIDFSNLESSSLSSSFTSNDVSIFNDLPSNVVVKFPPSITLSNSTNLSDTVFTIEGSTDDNVIHSSIDYPNGLNVTLWNNNANYVSIGVDNPSNLTWNNRMLEFVSNNFDLSTNTYSLSSNPLLIGKHIQEYYPRTFFGNTKLKKLTLSATDLYTTTTGASGQPNTYSQQDALFIHTKTSGDLTNNEYVAQYLPFGKNSSLTDFIFTNFDINDSPTYPEATNFKATISDNPLYKTTSKTWAQVATIINKFASNDNVNEPTLWPNNTTDGGDLVSGINHDSVVSGAQGTAAEGGGGIDNYIFKITNVYPPADGGAGPSTIINNNFIVSFPNSMPTTPSGTNAPTDVYGQVFYHNGVKWTLTVYSEKHKTNPGAITLIGENINVYKASRPNGQLGSSYQICFNEGVGDNPASKITVTLQICPPTTSTK